MPAGYPIPVDLVISDDHFKAQSLSSSSTENGQNGHSIQQQLSDALSRLELPAERLTTAAKAALKEPVAMILDENLVFPLRVQLRRKNGETLAEPHAHEILLVNSKMSYLNTCRYLRKQFMDYAASSYPANVRKNTYVCPWQPEEKVVEIRALWGPQTWGGDDTVVHERNVAPVLMLMQMRGGVDSLSVELGV